MIFSQKIRTFRIVGKNGHEAYIKGCKLLAKYMASKKYTNLSFKIEREEEKENVFLFTLFANIDVSSEQSHFCKMCKETHSLFFINEQYNCARCNLKAFLKRVSKKGGISKGFYESQIEDISDD